MVEITDVVEQIGDRYAISEIGSGGQKTVFRATSDTNDLVVKFVAIEEVDEDTGEKTRLSAIEERLHREIDLMRAVDSDFLPKLGPITLTECTIRDLRYLYFSELFIGEHSVKDMMKNGQFTPAKLKKMLSDVSKALQNYSDFEDGFVHRDVKPGNIMYCEEKNIFILIDGGIHMLPSNFTITESSAFIGTFRYASPEQIQIGRRSLDSRSDLFSLGVVTYEIAKGSHPFYRNGVDPAIGLRQHLNARYDPITEGEYLPFMPIMNKLITRFQHTRFLFPDELDKALQGVEV